MKCKKSFHVFRQRKLNFCCLQYLHNLINLKQNFQISINAVNTKNLFIKDFNSFEKNRAKKCQRRNVFKRKKCFEGKMYHRPNSFLLSRLTDDQYKKQKQSGRL